MNNDIDSIKEGLRYLIDNKKRVPEPVKEVKIKKSIIILEKEAVKLLQDNEPPEGYYGCFSGGKDSCVIKELATRAKVNVVWYYHPTPDPPELIKFIRKYHPEVIWTKPKKPFFLHVAKNGMPTPWLRFCCSISKEAFGKDDFKIIGVRAAESPRRAKSWSLVQPRSVAPILYWSDREIWQYIHKRKVEYCSLYKDENILRLGCVGCPLAGQKSRDYGFQRWPKYEKVWKKACQKLWENKSSNPDWIKKQSKVGFNSWEDHWIAWKGDLRAYFRKRKEMVPDTDKVCGDEDLTRYQQ